MAAPLPIFSPALPASPASSDFKEGTLIADIVSKFLPAIIAIGGFLAVVFIIVAGIQWITASGDPKKAEGARERLTYAVIGFIILVLAFAILQVVNYLFLGSNVA